ncbi:MAG: hypothetical protein AAGF99_05150 [Bacteroidota bacterium]
MSTKTIFRGLIEHLQLNLPVGLADVVVRYDGDAEAAIEEHVADLSGTAGASVLVGFTATQYTGRSLGGAYRDGQLPITILVVQRRHEVDAASQQAAMFAAAEALDDLADAVRDLLASNPRTLSGSGVAAIDVTEIVGLLGGGDWLGRALTCSAVPLPS